ncbi:hypothetical protein [Methylomonas sp. AM2-LC]|uniref:hypothetical protein n=1 Tax=Methylomonas sp. AM2-LC TaxID=3153301 RepID=UPI00326549F2
MAIKKTELSSLLWAGCDKLRGGKDYVLTLLFMKYVSDKYRGDPHGMIVVPQGGSAQKQFNCLDAIDFPFPSKEEQPIIQSDMDTEIQTLQQRLSKTRHIKQGMMQELLTGKTRLLKTSSNKSATENREFANGK